LRETILRKFFNELEFQELVTKSKITFKFKFTINFLRMNIIRDNYHKINGWNIKIDKMILAFNAKCHNSNIRIKDLFFIDDCSGLFLMENDPENKSSIYFFNAANSNKIMIS
jgi:hypothetical protein